MKKKFFLFYIFGIVIIQCTLYTGSAHCALTIDYVRLQQSLASGETSSILEEMYQAQLDTGARNCIPLSLLLISASRQLLADGNFTAALSCAEYARRCSVDFPAAILYEQLLIWNSNRLMLHGLFSGFIRSCTQTLFTLNELAFYALIHAAVLGAALLITIAGLGIVSLVRNAPLLYHDTRHILPQLLPVHTARALLILIIIAPLLLGFSIVWLFPYWLILFWNYHSARERALIGLGVLTFVFVLPLLAIGCSFFLHISQSDAIQHLWRANYDYNTRQDIEKIEQAAAANPDQYSLVFSAALVNKRKQNHTTALNYYERLLRTNPRDYRVRINAGNVYYAQGSWNNAVEYYEKAASDAPRKSAAAYFNLTRAYQHKFMFKEAEQSLVQAKLLDSARVENFLAIYSENYNRLLIDEILSRRELWLEEFRSFLQQPHLFNSIWGMVFAGSKLPYGTLALLALLLFNLIISVSDSVRVATRCTLCGKIMCLRCQRTIAADVLCLQCQNFFKKQDQLSYKQKDAKKDQIRAHVRSFRKGVTVLSILLPGMAHVWKGRYVQGAFFTFIFYWLFFHSVASLAFRGPWSDIASFRFFSFTVYALLAVLIWFALRAHIRIVKSADIEDNIMLTSLGLDT